MNLIGPFIELDPSGKTSPIHHLCRSHVALRHGGQVTELVTELSTPVGDLGKYRVYNFSEMLINTNFEYSIPYRKI